MAADVPAKHTDMKKQVIIAPLHSLGSADDISNSILWSQQVDILVWVKRWDLSEQRVFTCELMSYSLEHPHPPRKKNIHLFLSLPNRLRRLHASTILRRGKLQQFLEAQLTEKECCTHKLSCFLQTVLFGSVWFKVLYWYKRLGLFHQSPEAPRTTRLKGFSFIANSRLSFMQSVSSHNKDVHNNRPAE